ncbi:hypothetical protein E2C01_077186 [Portunus trituberculatus]|uniref:Uncharacterized protein n=1 Tax=Portunus trituberculatus TaxID=210409 RepID=A0A5B7IQP4_PORTR|nr:hypothetical protein [Portunus trituberculatus]
MSRKCRWVRKKRHKSTECMGSVCETTETHKANDNKG